MTQDNQALLEAAREYCRLIESADEHRPGWLQRLAALLPRLHAQVEVLMAASGEEGEPLVVDLDARFELFSRLHRLLGEKDAYWMEFDVAQDGQQMSGSLADDLTDIYCELKHGLALLDDDPRRTLNRWRSGYRMHWGQHLVDAERHLYELSVRNQLAP